MNAGCFRDRCSGAVIGFATLLDAHTRSDGSVRAALHVSVCEKHAKQQERKGFVVTRVESTPSL